MKKALVLLIGLLPIITTANESRFVEECTVSLQGEKDDVTITVPLANTVELRVQGLSYLYKPGDGMLFKWQENRRIGFWMKDTPFDLDIAFMGDEGKITSIHEMQAGSEELVEADAGATAALEVPHGFFSLEGIREGDTVNVVGCNDIQESEV